MIIHFFHHKRFKRSSCDLFSCHQTRKYYRKNIFPHYIVVVKKCIYAVNFLFQRTNGRLSYINMTLHFCKYWQVAISTLLEAECSLVSLQPEQQQILTRLGKVKLQCFFFFLFFFPSDLFCRINKVSYKLHFASDLNLEGFNKI
jgi:hypothetical protein